MYETQKWDQTLKMAVEFHLFLTCTEVWNFTIFTEFTELYIMFPQIIHPIQIPSCFHAKLLYNLCIIWDLNINSWWLWGPLLFFHQWPHSHYQLVRQIVTFIQGCRQSRCFFRNEIVLTDAFSPLFTQANLTSRWQGQNK